MSLARTRPRGLSGEREEIPVANSLERLLAPHTTAEFFSEIWEQRLLLVSRGDPSYYDDILRERDVEQLLADRFATNPDAIEIFHPDPEVKVRRKPGTIEHVTTAYSLGATIRCYGADQVHIPIRRLCQLLEWQFNAAVGANLYCTPPNAHGLRRHFDCHDTLILQIAGRKYWQVLPPAVEMPLEFMPAFSFESRDQTDERINARNVEYGELAAAVTASKQEYILEQGDLLYVPRGHVHEPSTQEAFSIHITMGIYPVTWRDALAVALNQLADTDVRLRSALPARFFSESLSTEEHRSVREFIAEIAQNVDLNRAIDEIARQFAATRATPSLNLSLSHVSDMTYDSVIRRGPSSLFRVLKEETRVGLCWGPKTLWAPLPVAEAFWRLSKAKALKVREIGCGLSEQAMLTLAKRLVREGGFVLKTSGLRHCLTAGLNQ